MDEEAFSTMVEGSKKRGKALGCPKHSMPSLDSKIDRHFGQAFAHVRCTVVLLCIVHVIVIFLYIHCNASLSLLEDILNLRWNIDTVVLVTCRIAQEEVPCQLNGHRHPPCLRGLIYAR